MHPDAPSGFPMLPEASKQSRSTFYISQVYTRLIHNARICSQNGSIKGWRNVELIASLLRPSRNARGASPVSCSRL